MNKVKLYNMCLVQIIIKRVYILGKLEVIYLFISNSTVYTNHLPSPIIDVNKIFVRCFIVIY